MGIFSHKQRLTSGSTVCGLAPLDPSVECCESPPVLVVDARDTRTFHDYVPFHMCIQQLACSTYYGIDLLTW